MAQISGLAVKLLVFGLHLVHCNVNHVSSRFCQSIEVREACNDAE